MNLLSDHTEISQKIDRTFCNPFEEDVKNYTKRDVNEIRYFE